MRVDVAGAPDGYLDQLLSTDVRDWIHLLAAPPERPTPETRVPALVDAAHPAPFGSVLVAFGFRRLELFHDGRLREIRPLGPPTGGVS